MKNNGLSEELNAVLRDIDKLKKTMRNKKRCFITCDSEEIRKAFIWTLKFDLMDLYNSLNDWWFSGMHVTADEDDCNAD